MQEIPHPERQQPSTEKLVTAVTHDFPEVREVLVSFPDQRELLRSFRRQDLTLYASGLPHAQERLRRDHFYGLSLEINLALTRYRHYRLFEPWPQPVVPVVCNVAEGRAG